jgi:uncharacterized protein YndB with AHSA1/START domain
MTKIQVSVMVDRPTEEVWRFMSDFSNTPKWSPDIIEMKQTSPGPLGVGSTVLIRHPKQSVKGRVTEYEPNQSFMFEVASGPARGTKVGYRMERIEPNTRLTYTFDFKLEGFYRLVGPFVSGRATKQGKAEAETNVSNVKRILESETRANA